MDTIDYDEKREALKGARFLRGEADLVESDIPRKPGSFSPKDKFRQRFRELGGIVTGDHIDDAIQYGECYYASEGCYAFVLFKPGVTLSFVWELEENRDGSIGGKMVTVWPYVYDREKALDSGLWSSSQINTMEDVVARNMETEDK